MNPTGWKNKQFFRCLVDPDPFPTKLQFLGKPRAALWTKPPDALSRGFLKGADILSLKTVTPPLTRSLPLVFPLHTHTLSSKKNKFGSASVIFHAVLFLSPLPPPPYLDVPKGSYLRTFPTKLRMTSKASGSFPT